MGSSPESLGVSVARPSHQFAADLGTNSQKRAERICQEFILATPEKVTCFLVETKMQVLPGLPVCATFFSRTVGPAQTPP